MKSSTLFVPLLAAASAYAHGILATMTIEGKAYQGNFPDGPKHPSVIRDVSDYRPVKGAKNPDIGCGLDAKPAKLIAHANPGDKVSFKWKDIGNISFIHGVGPESTYMGSCGNKTCDEFDSTQAKWFKIQQRGKKPNSDSWFQEDLMKGGDATVNLPSNIAPGNYLIRHEIIALHLGNTKGGAEFYPACAQLTVGGNGTSKPTPSELVSFPGAYSDDDPGIYDPDIFEPAAKYQFPGPPIAKFVTNGGNGATTDDGGDDGDNTGTGSGCSSTDGSGGGGGSGGSARSATSTAKGSRPTGGSAVASSSGFCSSSKCKRKNAASSSTADNNSYSKRSSLNVRHYPKHISRVMRDLASGQSHSH